MKALLGVPDDVHFVCLVTIGRPATDPQETALVSRLSQRRLELGELVRWEHWEARRSGEPATSAARNRATVSTTRSTSACVVDQFDTEIRSRRSPRHVVAPIQHVPSSCIASITRSVSAVRHRPAPAPG